MGDIEARLAMEKRIAIIQAVGQAAGVGFAIAGAETAQALDARKIRQRQAGPEEFLDSAGGSARAHARSIRSVRNPESPARAAIPGAGSSGRRCCK